MPHDSYPFEYLLNVTALSIDSDARCCVPKYAWIESFLVRQGRMRLGATPVDCRSRSVYSLTSEGTGALATWRQQVPHDLPELRDPGLLQLYFGADPVPLAHARAEAHRRQLHAYELRQRQDTGQGPRGPWLTLQAGIAHEREWVRFWTRLADDDKPTD